MSTRAIADPKRMHPARRAGGGFTMVELMVVVVIIGIIAGVVVVSWESVLPKEQFFSNVRALAERIRGARSDSIAQNAEFWVHYQIDEDRYWISAPFVVGGGAAAFARQDALKSGMVEREEQVQDRVRLFETKLADGVDLVSVTIDGETYRDGTVQAVCNPLGASTYHTIVLHHQLSDVYFTIEVEGLTGVITLHDGIWEREPPKDTDFN